MPLAQIPPLGATVSSHPLPQTLLPSTILGCAQRNRCITCTVCLYKGCSSFYAAVSCQALCIHQFWRGWDFVLQSSVPLTGGHELFTGKC